MSKFYKPIGDKMCVFPVGSVYLTMIKENPSKYYGGTWEFISGGYIYAADSTLSKTDYSGWGAQSTTLTVDQIPSHQHLIKMRNAGKWGWNDGSATGDMLEGGYSWQGSATTYNWLIENSPVGGSKGHTHNIATIDVFMYKRIA